MKYDSNHTIGCQKILTWTERNIYARKFVHVTFHVSIIKTVVMYDCRLSNLNDLPIKEHNLVLSSLAVKLYTVSTTEFEIETKIFTLPSVDIRAAEVSLAF